MELLCHSFFLQGAHAHIDDVTGNEYKVGLLSINHVHPTAEFLARIVIADVQVADHH